MFWTKNAEPFIKYLPELDRKNLNYYFTYSLNDYEAEGLEPNVPPLKHRIEIFKKLSDSIGKQKVVWRFDPLKTFIVFNESNNSIPPITHPISNESSMSRLKEVFE